MGFWGLFKKKTVAQSIPQKCNYPEFEKHHVEKAIDRQKKTFDELANSIKTSVMSNSKRYKYDLVVFHDYGSGCCEECSKKTGRVYSISGKNKRFPPLPDYVRKHGNFHAGCRCTMSPYFDDETIYYKGVQVNAIKASSRPWCDDRTEKERQLYDEYINSITSDAKHDAAKEWDRNEYNVLLSELPSEAPKSFSSYRRMKNGNTSGFKKLQEKALEKGIKI